MKIRSLIVGATAVLLTACATADFHTDNTDNSATERVTLIVASEMTDCVGVAPQKCLLVKENPSQQDWHYFYSNIDGFNYEPGFEYTLLIDKVPRKNVAQDQSSIDYRLVKAQSKKAITSKNLPKTMSTTTKWNRIHGKPATPAGRPA